MENKEKNSLKRLMNVLKKNSLKIVLILFLFILCGYFYSYNMVVPKYKSISTILLTSDNVNKDTQSVTQNDINLNKSLIATYGKILKSNNVLNKVIERLNLNMTYGQLYANVQIEEVTNTQMIKVGVISESALEAQRITETLDQVFMEEIKEFYKMDNISIVDSASLETTPYNINHVKDILLFFIAGVMFSGLMISIIYILDTTIKIEQDLEEYVGINVIGSVPLHKSKKEELIVQNSSKSVVSEAFKTIRTNISFSKSKEQSKTILFTSCNSSEGKSWVASNMAVAYAWSNKNVIVVDADMRKGRQHNIFHVSNENGLSDCLREIENNEDYENLKRYIKQTNVPKVHIMTIGTLPPNPSELLSSNSMNNLVHMLKCIYDVVIIDGTPCNLVTDSIPVSRTVDSTVLVAECRKTKIEDLKNIIKQIQNVGGNIEGAILNKKEIKSKEYGKGYYYGKVDNDATVEIETHTVQELIDNRKQYVEEVVEIAEESKEDRINELVEKIENLEDKLLKIPDMNLASYTQAVEDIRNIYENEIDKNKLAESIKDNIVRNELMKKLEETGTETKNIVEQKIEELNHTNEIESLIEKIDNIETAINQDETEEKIVNMISDMKEEQNRKIEELNNSKLLTDLLEKMENLTENQNANSLQNNVEARNILEQINVLTQNQNQNIEKTNTETRSLLKTTSEETKSLIATNHEQTRSLLEENSEQTKNLLEQNSIETRNILEEKMEDLNYKDEIKSLMQKVDNLESNMRQDTIEQSIKLTEEAVKSMISDMRKEQNEKMQELDSSKLLADILKRIDQITQAQEMSSNEQAMASTRAEEKLIASNTRVEERLAETNSKVEEKLVESNNRMEEKLEEVIAAIKSENQRKLEKLDNANQIEEIRKELKKINDRYDKLAQEVNKNMENMKKEAQKRNVKSATTRNNVIELEKAKKKLRKEELIIEYGQEIAYEQLLDLAIDVYDLNGSDDTTIPARKAE